MHKRQFQPQPDHKQFISHVDSLRDNLRKISQAIPLEQLAERTGATLSYIDAGIGEFRLTVIGIPIKVTLPAWEIVDIFKGQALPPTIQALVLYYFTHADGTMPVAKWISFADLPDGRFYNTAFQGYTGYELARNFQNDLDSLERASKKVGGTLLTPGPQIPGDRAYHFQILPRLSIIITYWEGDEDFPASAQVLFEISASNYLPTDLCAYIGSTIVRKVIHSKQ